MTREDNEAEGKTWVYTYDLGGNITSKTTYAYTLDDPDTVLDTAAYSYYTGTWKDLLVGYDGLTIESDVIGNPKTVKQGNTVIRSYTWEHGRQLASLTEDGTTWNYTYNTAGLRTERTNGSKTYTYVYNGSQLTYMTVDGHTLWFSYDAHGPMYVKYDGTTYLYVTNLQGDIIAIVNNSGNAVVEYTYDAWGNILSTSGSMSANLGAYNPLRYRGYVYDTETELYYLQSRYYDPKVGRFINADGYTSTGQGLLGNNMFVYCGNNPIIKCDPWGNAHQNVFFPVCYGGVGVKPISGHSDGKNESDNLLEYIYNNFIPYTDSTVYVDVSYARIYTKETNHAVSNMFAILGGLSILGLIPFVGKVAWASTALTVAGTASSVYGMVGLLAPESLPDKDYYQYEVIISWTETSTVAGYPNVLVQTSYTVEMSFLWDDTSYTSPTWYIQSSNWSENRKEIRI